MTALVEFLLARIAEDEEAAREAPGPTWVRGVDREGGPGHWRACAELVMLPADDPLDSLAVGDAVARIDYGGNSSRAYRTGEHIARWDPARVLAECEAKRAIVEHCSDWRANEYECEPVLQMLALPYAGHPDYREEWRA